MNGRVVILGALIASAMGVACSSAPAQDAGLSGIGNAALAEGGGDGASPAEDDASADASVRDDGAADRAMQDDGAADALTPDSPDDAPPPACPILQTPSARAGAAVSAGFTGTDTAYFALYGAACQSASDCGPACVAAGGTMASCAIGSECLPGETTDGGPGCLPPTYWLTVHGALSESGMTSNAAELILVDIPYDDRIVLTNFGVAIPDDASVTGIQVKIRRATLTGNAVDDAVQILRNGAPVGTDHGQAGPWPLALAYASYGGAYDLWGASWTVADVRSIGFGVSIAPKYTGPAAGNERAYIDSVRVAVFYRATCE